MGKKSTELGKGWWDGSLPVLPHYQLFITEKSLRKEQKRLGQMPEHDDWPVAGITLTYHGVTSSNRPLCYVCVNTERMRKKKEVYALLVHEAVHVHQRGVEWMGEREPSREFEAYAIQRISLDLFTQYDEKVGKGGARE